MTSPEWPGLPAVLAGNKTLEAEWAKTVGKAIADLEQERRKQPLTKAAKQSEDSLAVERRIKENNADLDRRYVEDDADLHKKTEEDMMEVAKASIERARDSAKFIQIAATAVAGIYTGVLGLAYSVAANPLPAEALIPTLFLGLAVALATGYLGFLTEPKDAASLKPSGSPRINSQRRTDFFVMWTRGIAMNRASLLRAGVVSFVIGVVLLPLSVVEFRIDPLGSGANGSAAAVASATPTPSPAPWPTPAMTEPIELAAVLYEAQLAEFREAGMDQGKTAAATQSDDAGVLAVLMLVGGLLLVTAFWLEWLPRDAKKQRRDAASTRPRPTIK